MSCTSACMVKVRVLWIDIKLLLKDDHKEWGIDFILRIVEHTVLHICMYVCMHPINFGMYLLYKFIWPLSFHLQSIQKFGGAETITK